jgi:hypothetical protein
MSKVIESVALSPEGIDEDLAAFEHHLVFGTIAGREAAYILA